MVSSVRAAPLGCLRPCSYSEAQALRYDNCTDSFLPQALAYLRRVASDGECLPVASARSRRATAGAWVPMRSVTWACDRHQHFDKLPGLGRMAPPAWPRQAATPRPAEKYWRRWRSQPSPSRADPSSHTALGNGTMVKVSQAAPP